MKSFLKLVLYVAIGAAIFLGACYIRGMYLPAQDEISRSVTIMAPREDVFKTILDYNALPQWYQGVTSVAPLPSEDGAQCYDEVHGKDHAKVCERIVTPGKVAVDRIEEKNFNGTWTYELTSINGTATHLTTTQRGTIASPLMRLMAYQFGLDEEINKFHADLKKRMER